MAFNPSMCAVVCVMLSVITHTGCSEPIQPKDDSAFQSESKNKHTSSSNPSQAGPKSNAAGLDESKTLLQLAQQHLIDGQYAAAVTAAEKLVALQPDSGSNQFLLGETAFMAGEITKSIKAFDKMISIDPPVKPRLWQRGLAYYYANEFDKGVEQFEAHQTVNPQDVENAVWHMLCSAKLIGIDEARNQLFPIRRDSRIPMKEIFRLFSGEISPEDVVAAAQDAPLAAEIEKKVSLFYAYLYNSLFYEMTGQHQKATHCMVQADAINPSPKDNFMGRVAAVHLMLRAGGRESETPAKK